MDSTQEGQDIVILLVSVIMKSSIRQKQQTQSRPPVYYVMLFIAGRKLYAICYEEGTPMPRMKKTASLEDKITQRLEKTAKAAGLNVAAYPYLTALTKSDAARSAEALDNEQPPQTPAAE